MAKIQWESRHVPHFQILQWIWEQECGLSSIQDVLSWMPGTYNWEEPGIGQFLKQ